MPTNSAAPLEPGGPGPARRPSRRVPLLLALLASTAGACGPLLEEPGANVPDPEGTRTTTINFTIQPHPIVLYQGPAADGPYMTHRFVQVLTGVDASLNVHFTTVTSALPDFSASYLIYENQGGEVAAIGRVAGLGAITDVPRSGWGPIASAEPGNGYVLRFKPARNVEANLPVIHARLYIVQYLTSTSGGIIGARVKYQLPFLPR